MTFARDWGANNFPLHTAGKRDLVHGNIDGMGIHMASGETTMSGTAPTEESALVSASFTIGVSLGCSSLMVN